MRPSLLGLYAFAPLFACAQVACSAPVVVPGGGSSSDPLVLRAGAEGTSTAALVVLERTVTARGVAAGSNAADSDGTAHASAVARFIKMRVGSVDDQALRMVGATLDLPALGTCAPAGSSATDSMSGDAELSSDFDAPRAVELLDVGALSIEALEANGAQTTLEARSLPDIVDLVTGVLYSARSSAPDTDGLPSRGSYLLRAAGSSVTADAEHSVPSFTVAATAPGEPSELRIGGQDARDEAGVTLDAGAAVDLRWSASDLTGVSDDVVYVELISAPVTSGVTSGLTSGGPTSKRAATVRCLFADRGSAAIPASAFRVADQESPATQAGATGKEMTRGTIVVHRIHRETFQVAGHVSSTGTAGAGPAGAGQLGIDSGVIRFDFARAAEFTRR